MWPFRDRLYGIERSLYRIEHKLGIVIRKEIHMAGELDKLEADVTAESGVIDSAIALLNGLHQLLLDAIASGDMSRVAAVNAQIEAKTQALADAVAANPPPPPPTP